MSDIQKSDKKKLVAPEGYSMLMPYEEFVEKYPKLHENDFGVGSVFMYYDHIYRVKEVKWGQYKDEDPYIIIMCEEWLLSGRWSKELNHKSLSDVNGYAGNFNLKFNRPLEEYTKEARKVIESGGNMEEYEESLGSTEQDDKNTSLLHMGNKDSLISMQSELERVRDHMEIVRYFVGLELEKKKRELEAIRSNMYGLIAQFEKKIVKIMRVVTTIELFLGVEEEILQIQEGPSADPNTPISIRQRLHFMDEEMGDPREDLEGMDFRDIEEFDDWLRKNNNYKKVLPEQKGILALQIRRTDKKYSDNPFINDRINENNRQTYMLLRNGDNLYRLITDKIEFKPRLFPKKDELQELKDKWDEYDEKEREIEKKGGTKSYHESSKEKLEDDVMFYKMRLSLLQGLVERTNIFKPCDFELRFFDNATYEDGKINLIYDDEATLPSGRLPFLEFMKKINQEIDFGSRIVLAWNRKNDKWGMLSEHDRFDDRYGDGKGWSRLPEMPQKGLYFVKKTIKKVKVPTWIDNPEFDPSKPETKSLSNGWSTNNPKYIHDGWEPELAKKPFMCIRYNPKDTVGEFSMMGDYDPHERQVAVSWKIYKDDDIIINYDAITIEDIEFYLDSRVDRKDYLYAMPILHEMLKAKQKEVESEKDFVKMIEGQLITLGKSQDGLHEEVLGAVKWWKSKNKWKRAISHDDEKALRMIVKKLRPKK